MTCIENYVSMQRTFLIFATIHLSIPTSMIATRRSLGSKMYFFLLVDGTVQTESKLTKGVAKSVIDNYLTFTQYLRCLDETLQLTHTFKAIRRLAYSVSTKELEKVSLSSFDDKRYLLNAIYSLPYGHYKLDMMPQPENRQRKRIKRPNKNS